MKKKHVVSFIVILVLIIGGVAIYYMYRLNKYKNAINNIKIEDLALNEIADGTYEGEYDVDYIYVKLNTTVKNKQIIKIEILEHKNDRGKPAERIVDDIIKNQSLDVDDISGATNSSKVIKESIMNSLKNSN